jgi:curved DNA-binding protein
MMNHRRRKISRETVNVEAVVYWQDASGQERSMSSRVSDLSEAGVRLEGPERMEPGQKISINLSLSGCPRAEATVCYCILGKSGFRIGVEFSELTRRSVKAALKPELDYYEVLQLSRSADVETIHRVYRIMATRLHPDNAESGDPEKFLLLTEAYKVLSDPEKRARYDAIRGVERPRPLPLFHAKAFVDEQEGEANRRLGVLCLLYAQRRRDPGRPGISLLELEELMAYPREYLEFTLWYLKEKKYLTSDQSAEFVLTATGVDFVEEHTPAHAVLHKLLESGRGRIEPGVHATGAQQAVNIQ